MFNKVEKSTGIVPVFNKAKVLIEKYKTKVTTFILTMFTLLVVNCPVLADGIQTQGADQVEGKIFGSTKIFIQAFGGAAIGIGFAIIAFKMIFCHKRQEARAEAMESIVWVGGGAIILGGIAVFTGFIWGTLGGK